MINRINFSQMPDFNELVSKTIGLIDESKNKMSGDIPNPTYFPELDSRIRGFESGKITAIVGRPSMGKTLFALNVVRRMVSKGTPVLVFSLSLCKEDWTRCFLCSYSGLDLHKARTGFLKDEETTRLHQTGELASSLPLYVKDEQRNLEEIIEKISKVIKEEKIKTVLIDGMSNIYGNTLQTMKSRGQRYDKQLKILKEKAEEWGIPLLITQSLSRRTERDPYLLIPKHEYGLKEGNLSRYADRILQLYREEYYNPTKKNRGMMNIRIPAMKFGECDTSICVHFDRSTGLVKEYDSKPFDPDRE